MSKKNTAKSLSSSLTIILVSTAVCVVLTVVAAMFTGELLYLVATALFIVSGVAGVWVVRKLQRTLGQ